MSEIPAEKVKNNQPLRSALLPESAHLPEQYLATWHPVWGAGVPWLFPNRAVGHVRPSILSHCIARRAGLARTGVLMSHETPGERAAENRLRAFLSELQGRVAPVSVGMMAGALLRMLTVLQPGGNWSRLAAAYNWLKQTAEPSRD